MLARLFDIPVDSIIETVGRVNLTEFIDVDAGLLLFAGATADKEMTQNGQINYVVTYTFKQRANPWNYMWNRIDGEWRSVVSINGTTDIYEEVEFEGLLGEI